TSDTLISMYFGNKTTITNQANPTAVWEEGYLAVHHLEEDPSGSISDSTGNSYNMSSNGAMDSTNLVAAIIDQGVEFGKGLDQYYSSQDTLNLTSSFTFSLWVNLRNSNVAQTLVTVGEDPALAHRGLIISNTNMLMFNSSGYSHSFGSLSASTWYHVFLVYNQATSTLKAYINGTQFGTTGSIGLASILSEFFFAGSQFFDRLNGTLDEVRLSEVARSPAWISTAFQNQADPSNFYSIGLEEHMEDLDPPEVVAFGVYDPGNGHPEFWAEVIDDFSGVMTVNITLNGTKYEMSLNGSGYWVYQPSFINFNDAFSYFVNCSDFEGHLSPNTVTKNVRFDKDTVAPTIEYWNYISDLGPYGTFNATVSDWGIIHTVMVNVTEIGSGTTSSAVMRLNTTSGYVNDTLELERGPIEYLIIANDTMGNTNTTSDWGFVSFGVNDAPMAEELHFDPDPVHSNEDLHLNYIFSDPNDDSEWGTEIRWYKNGSLQPEHNDTKIITATYLFKGDQWNATVRPKDGDLFGSLEATNLTVIQNSLPIVSTVHFILKNEKINPFNGDRDFILMDEGLNLSYTFFDADPSDSDKSTINWYVNGTPKPQYTNRTFIPAIETTPGEIYKVEIIPHDGEEASPAIWSKNVTIESRPVIYAYGVQPLKTKDEGIYRIWIQADDELRNLDRVEYEVCINDLVVDGESYIHYYSISFTNGTAQMWVLEFHLLDLLNSTNLRDYNYSPANFTDLLNSTLTVKVRAYTHVIYASLYTIWEEVSLNFTLMDVSPPRIPYAGVEWEGPSPTNVTFWAIIIEYGRGIDEVLLYYEFRSAGAQTKLFDLSHGPIPMFFNGTHWIATVPFSSDQRYEILFQISVFDLEGNSNLNAYLLGLDPSKRPDGTFNPPPQDITPFLIIGGIIIAIIGIAAVVAVRVFRRTELVGLDISKVMEASQELPQEEIIKNMSGHTLGIVISTFDQLSGPIPLFVEPPILKDNFEKLIELSDRAFSAVRFIEDFEREIYTAFEIDFGIVVASISYGFALDRPEARGGAENISLNILVHKPFDVLITKFADAYADDVHQIHMLMNQGTTKNEQIAKLVEKIRKTITAIILAYEEMYGSVEELELD
ncbi:MAG: LamG domain-containing protein, partial [Promethearchaeota archaeon]